MKNLAKKISEIKFNLKIPSQKKILIYDNYSTNILSKIIDKNYNILMTRFEEISLPILFISCLFFFFDFIRLKNLYFNYLKTFIIISNPKVIITFIDNDKNFYKFKKSFQNKKFIAIQNGYRFYKDDLFESIDKTPIKFQCDEYHCFGEGIKKYLINKIEGKIINSGSIKNNYCKKKNISKSGVCFISSFGISNNKFEKKILSSLNFFCKKNKLKLYILARSKKDEEYNFFKKIFIKKNFFYIKKKDNFCESYNIIDKVELSISLNATLGYENLSRGNKTFFLNVNDRNINCSSFLKFGYPYNFSKKGYFWTNKYDDKNFINQITEIYNESPVIWLSKTSETIKKIIDYDPDNKKLKKQLKKHL